VNVIIVNNAAVSIQTLDGRAKDMKRETEALEDGIAQLKVGDIVD
jgi:hypothetical protein